MVEIIKKSFEHDYKEALAGFGNGDYVLFLRNVRVAFEWLCKLIANDVLEDDILFQDLLEGNKTITCDWNLGVCSISAGDGVAKEESSLAFLARNSIYYKKPQLLTNDKAMKRVKKAIDQTFQDIFFWYGIISGEGSHSKIEEDARMQSEAIASLLPIWIKELGCPI